MGFFKVLFYLGMVIPILVELESIFSPRRAQGVTVRARELRKLHGKEMTDALLADKEVSTTMLFHTYYLIWLFVGLFSSLNWPVFIFMFLLGVIPKRFILQRWLDGVMSFALLLFTVINAFHLHLNVFNVLRSLL